MSRLRLPVETERLVLRHYEPGDLKYELRIQSDEPLFAHLPIDPRSEEEVEATMEKRLAHQGLDEVGETTGVIVETADGGEFVGALQISPIVLEPLQVEIGWLAVSDQQGKGYMTEAVRGLVDLAFDSEGAHRVVAEIIGGNDASVRLAERLGFRKEGHFRKSLLVKDEWRDELIYGLLREEWMATR